MRSRRPCPVRGCSRSMEPSHAMCRVCWFFGPKELRDDVWRTFRDHGVLSDEYQAALEAALEHAERARLPGLAS